jgi:hypothetical protein
VVVIGVEPQVIAWSLDLSPAVEDAWPVALGALRDELREAG